MHVCMPSFMPPMSPATKELEADATQSTKGDADKIMPTCLHLSDGADADACQKETEDAIKKGRQNNTNAVHWLLLG